MEFVLKPSYERVLVALRDGQPKDHDDICLAAGLEDFACTGAISVLRRAKALEQAGNHQYKITEKGKDLLERAPRLVVNPRHG
jgi:predicted transcriptional regulator